MARLIQIGFEENSLTTKMELRNINGSPTIQSGVSRTGTYALKISSLASGTKQSVATSFNNTVGNGPYFARFYFRVDTLPSAENRIAAITSDLGGHRAYITINSSGVLTLYDQDAVNLGTSSALSTGTWYRIEFRFKRTDNTASCEISARVDGIDFGSETTGTISTGIGKLEVGGNMNSETQTQGVWYFDDLAVNDDTGTHQTSYPGDGKIIYLRPNAAGDANSFATQTGGTAGSSNNYTRVNEVTPDDATTYNASNTLNEEDLFNFDASGIGASDTVNVVAVNPRFANDVADATTAFKVEILKTSGGTKSQSAAMVPNSTTWRTNTENGNASTKNEDIPPLITYTDPDGSAWTQTTLDSMQAGYIISAGSTNKVLISTLWVSVDYTASSGTAYTLTLTDSITPTETFIKSTTKVFSESISPAETFIKAITKVFTETVTESETFTTLKTQYKTFTESISPTEVFTKLTGKNFSESITPVESFIKYTQKFFSDVITPVESFGRGFFKSFTESISPSETFTKLAGKSFTETISPIETLVKSISKKFTESITPVENFATSLVHTLVMRYPKFFDAVYYNVFGQSTKQPTPGSNTHSISAPGNAGDTSPSANINSKSPTMA